MQILFSSSNFKAVTKQLCICTLKKNELNKIIRKRNSTLNYLKTSFMVTNNYYRTTHTLNSLWCLDLKVNQTTKNRQFVANQVITKKN